MDLRKMSLAFLHLPFSGKIVHFDPLPHSSLPR